MLRTPRRLVVIGASAGGVPALTTLAAGLPADLNAAVLVVLHVPAKGRSVLPDILERAGPMPAAHPRDREPLVAGQIYVAPPDHHLAVYDTIVRVTRGPWENGYRPSIDVLFRSAARWYRSDVVGLVLTGALDDGASGLAAVHDVGGTALVQEPTDAAVPEMPLHALEAVPSACSYPIDEIAAAVREAVGDAPGNRPIRRPPRDSHPISIPDERLEADAAGHIPAGLVCPDCGGSMFDLDDSNVLRFRCRVGHGWTADALTGAHAREFEQTLWAAIRILEEDEAVHDRIISRARNRGRATAVQRFEEHRDERRRLASTLRAAIARAGSQLREDLLEIDDDPVSLLDVRAAPTSDAP
jgi:two-component system, chemotaxis family, protein-glutamate methylesterase/glutaminase